MKKPRTVQLGDIYCYESRAIIRQYITTPHKRKKGKLKVIATSFTSSGVHTEGDFEDLPPPLARSGGKAKVPLLFTPF